MRIHRKTLPRLLLFRLGFVHHSPRPGGSGLYHYALILYHLTTAMGQGSVVRSVSGNANVNSRRFGSPPAEICGDLRELVVGRNG